MRTTVVVVAIVIVVWIFLSACLGVWWERKSGR